MLLTSIIAAAWGSGAELGAMQACEGGDGEACRLAAEASMSGDGLRVDFARAIELFGRACELGSGESCVILAERYRDGLDVERALDLAAQWYREGCQRGLGDACRGAAALHAEGAFEGATQERADELYRLGCDRHDAASCLAVVASLTGEGEVAPDEARPFLERACEGEAVDACVQLGAQAPRSEALRWHARGCELGHVPSCRLQGLRLTAGLGRDLARGRQLLHEACEADDALACAALGNQLRRTDPRAALDAASRACGLGIDKACRRAWKLRRKVEP